MLKKFISKLVRRKHVTLDDTELARVLTLFDLTCMGTGATIGIGFYVLAGQVARNIAGPAVVLCFLIAGVASLISGLCYAEFGARVPKAGSAYVYSYVCVGEFVAFVIGWNLILEYVIGTSSVAKGYSSYIDELANNTMSQALTDVMPIHVSFFETFPDFLAFGISFLIAVALALGVKESTMFNNVCTALNLIVVIYTIIAAATQADPYNWKIPKEDLNITCTEERGQGLDWGAGGFAPYGFTGIMQGAATCFFGFVGFDCIATAGEEALRPERNIPISIAVSLLFIFVAYFGMGATLTLALPYCLQNADAPLVDFFERLGWEASKWFVSIGALFGFSASLFGVLLPLPRILYAMANDGIIFKFFGRINKRFRTPALATIISGIFAGLMAMFFNLNALVDMMSIGTLLAYTIVALSVMLLRYNVDDDIVLKEPSDSLENGEGQDTQEKSKSEISSFSFRMYLGQLFNTKGLKEPTPLTSSLVNYATIIFCFTCSAVVLLLVLVGEKIAEGDGGAIAGLVVAIVVVLLNIFVIHRQPQSSKTLTFSVPFVPWLPAFSSLINLYLMFNLSTETWIRFSVWMGIGLPLYFFYGMPHSKADDWKSLYKNGIDNPIGPSEEEKPLPLYTISGSLPDTADTKDTDISSEKSSLAPEADQEDMPLSEQVLMQRSMPSIEEEMTPISPGESSAKKNSISGSLLEFSDGMGVTIASGEGCSPAEASSVESLMPEQNSSPVVNASKDLTSPQEGYSTSVTETSVVTATGDSLVSNCKNVLSDQQISVTSVDNASVATEEDQDIKVSEISEGVETVSQQKDDQAVSKEDDVKTKDETDSYKSEENICQQDDQSVSKEEDIKTKDETDSYKSEENISQREDEQSVSKEKVTTKDETESSTVKEPISEGENGQSQAEL